LQIDGVNCSRQVLSPPFLAPQAAASTTLALINPALSRGDILMKLFAVRAAVYLSVLQRRPE
jgi:hypothetical protein